MVYKSLLIFLFFLIGYSQGYKLFLYSPKFGKSHVTFMGKIADSLAKAGHDVVVYLPEYNLNITTTGTKHARTIIRPLDFEIPASLDELQGDIWSVKDQGMAEMQKMVDFLSRAHSTLCKHQLEDTKLMDQLKAEKFDLALGETFDSCYYGVIERIGIKNHITVFASAFMDIAGSMMGIPSTPSFSPGMVSEAPPLSYTGRAKNLMFAIFGGTMMVNSFLKPIERVVQAKLRPDFDIVDQLGKSAFILVNVDEHVDFPRIITHKIINIGGFGQSKASELEPKYEKIMNESKKGVVLVSFGSVAQSQTMPQEMKKQFLEAFAKFPDVTFLWKYENDEDKVAEGYKNVITGKWLPQTDLLAHPKLLAFISHGGANSIAEATYSGVPIICIPLFADQPRNALVVKYRNVGVSVDKKEILQGKLVDALDAVLNDEKYHKSAKRLSSMIQNKPMSADDRLVRYVEFAAKFGNDNNLDMHGRHLNFIEFYCLDIILPVLGLLFLVLYIKFRLFMFVIRKFLSLFGGSNKAKKE